MFLKKFLINAKTDLNFFEVLANTSMLVLNSPESPYGQDNVIAIQLPRPEKAHDALEIIKTGLVTKNDLDGASYRDLNPGHVLGKHEY